MWSSWVWLVVVVLLALPAIGPLGRSEHARKWILASLVYLGDVPEHVAIIMDGNRRWARNRHLQAQEGHLHGEQTMISTLAWGIDAGIRTITLYAFSIENFKRPQKEVDTIMELAVKNVQRMLEPESILHKQKVRARFWGQLSLVSAELRALCARLTCATQHYRGPVLNICFAYTARVEIAEAVAGAAVAAASGVVRAEDIDEAFLSQFLESGVAKGGQELRDFPDVLIRTSGETRLSDFLLWQSAFSYLAFLPVMWPDFTAFDYIRVALAYRRARHELRKRADQYARFQCEGPPPLPPPSDDRSTYLPFLLHQKTGHYRHLDHIGQL